MMNLDLREEYVTHLIGMFAVLGVSLGLTLTGCNPEDPGAGDDDAGDPPAVTWHQDIAPIASGTCQMCHITGGIAPFALETYEQASSMASFLAAVTSEKIMPPFDADETATCTPPHPYKNDISLTDSQIALFQEWSDLGAPEGDPATAATLPSPPSGELSSVSTTLSMTQPYVAQGSEDDYQCFVFDPLITETTWITGVQITPQVNRLTWTQDKRANTPAVAHHGLLYTDPDAESPQLAAFEGDPNSYPCYGAPAQLDPNDPNNRLVQNFSLVGGWVPGSLPNVYPTGTGLRIEPGTLLVLQIHFHPVDGLQIEDLTEIRLEWQTTNPGQEAGWKILGVGAESQGNADFVQASSDDVSGEPKFFVPAGAENHTETLRFTAEELGISSADIEVPLFGTLPHMHLLGSEASVKVERSQPQGNEPAEECLVDVPRYDFNWQRYYEFDAELSELPLMRAGDEIVVRCTYNNSASNPFVAEEWPNGPIPMYAGESTDTEMCIAIVGYVEPA